MRHFGISGRLVVYLPINTGTVSVDFFNKAQMTTHAKTRMQYFYDKEAAAFIEIRARSIRFFCHTETLEDIKADF